MITGFGIMFLPLCLYYWRAPHRLLELVFVGAAFAAAAVIVVGGYGVSPGLVPACMFIGLIALGTVFGTRYPGERIALRVLAPFIIAVIGGIVSSILMPRLFEGAILVWPEKMVGFPVITPLAPSAGNTTQDLYLALNATLAVTAAVYLTRAEASLQRLLNAYFVSGLFVVAISIWQFAGNIAGIWFPTDFFLSNPGWAILTDETVGSLIRISGPFSEPSALAGYLCGSVCAAALVMLNGSRALLPRWLLGSGALIIILSTSTTGYATLAITAALLVTYTIFRGSPAFRRRVVIGFAAIAVLAGACFVTVPVVAPNVARQANVIAQATFSKQSSSSYNDRVSADHDSMHEMVESYGLGVGWGSNRSSSLLPGLCASLGAWGLGLLLWFAVSLVVHVRIAMRVATPAQATVMYGCTGALLGNLAAAMVSAPVITSPDFFLLLALLIAAGARARYEARAKPTNRPAAAASSQTTAFTGAQTLNLTPLGRH